MSDKPRLLFKHHPLRDRYAERVLNHPMLRARLRLVDLTEPMDQAPDPAQWHAALAPDAGGLVWGMRKYGAAEFIDFARQQGLPVVIIERSPLLKNGRRSFYLDPFGTTDHGAMCQPGFWEWLLAQPFGPEERAQLAAYRQEHAGAAAGVENQAAPFEPKEVILSKLGLPQQAKIAFAPLQVDDDITIIDKTSSPFIHNMRQFVELLLAHADELPPGYVLIIKEHPANIMYGHETAPPPEHPRVRFVRDQVNANALTQQCDAIVSINSGVGMEGLLFHRPLVACGNSFYTGKGINVDVRSEEELAAALAGLDRIEVDRERVDRFLSYFIFAASFDLADPADSADLADKLVRLCSRKASPEALFARQQVRIAGLPPTASPTAPAPLRQRHLAIVTNTVPEPTLAGSCTRVRDLMCYLHGAGWRLHVVLQRDRVEWQAVNFLQRLATSLVVTPGPPPAVPEPPAPAPPPLSPLRRMKAKLVWHLSRSPAGVGLLNVVRRAVGRPPLPFSPLPVREQVEIRPDPTRCSPETAAALRELAGRVDLDAILVVYPWLAECLAGLETDAVRLLDTLDVHHRRTQMLVDAGLNPGWRTTREEETRLLRYFDAVIAIQRHEQAIFAQMVPERWVITAGTAFTPRAHPEPPEQDLVVIIASENVANAHGVRLFLEEVWPLVLAARPGARLEVCGTVKTLLRGVEPDPSVTIRGFVADIGELYARAAVLANPVWVGTGLKIKTVEGLSQGKALVTTTSGVEGVSPLPVGACVITDNPELMAREICRLLAKPEERRELEQRALAYAERHLTPAAIYAELDTVLLGQIPQPRPSAGV